jgi:pimeloyl-ACP methyl ester carboxylesterase
MFYVDADGSRLRVKKIAPSGQGSEPSLVFLHEGLGCIELWRDFPDALCEMTGCSGFVFDRRGYGGSPRLPGKWPKEYLETESYRLLPAFLKGCGITDVIFIGHSDGGTIALMGASKITAEKMGMRVRAVITEAAHVLIEDVTLEGIRQAVNLYESTDLKHRLEKYHGKNTDEVFFRWADTWLDPEFRDWNIEACLGDITCPALILQGAEDEYATENQVKRIVRQVSGPVSSAMIAGCGHVPHIQARDEVLLLMERFIADLPRL